MVSLLKLLKIAKSSYFYEIKTYERIDKDQEIKTEILDIFNTNQSETEFYTGIYPEDEKTQMEAARKLEEMGARTR